MLADLRYALRLFARSPLFTAAVVLVLGLSVGASTTVFTLVDAYLVKPLPFREIKRRLEAASFTEHSQKGSHVKFVRSRDLVVDTVIVPKKSGVPVGRFARSSIRHI